MVTKTMTEKLHKVLAQQGLGSRREIEGWIVAGRITVNGEQAQLGCRIATDAQVCLDGKVVSLSPAASSTPVLLLYHKPRCEVCTRHDPQGRTTVFERLPPPPSGRWVMIGRLDYLTSGLLLFTNDGAYAHQMMHPRFHVERVYLARIYGQVTADMMTRLTTQVLLEDGPVHFDALEPLGEVGSNRWYRVTISSGRNRIVRRLWESQGVQVNRLVRVRFGTIDLPQWLKPGESCLLKNGQQFPKKGDNA